jgi:hypothetical protein
MIAVLLGARTLRDRDLGLPGTFGLTANSWHLFAVFVAAIASVLISSFPLWPR